MIYKKILAGVSNNKRAHSRNSMNLVLREKSGLVPINGIVETGKIHLRLNGPFVNCICRVCWQTCPRILKKFVRKETQKSVTILCD